MIAIVKCYHTHHNAMSVKHDSLCAQCKYIHDLCYMVTHTNQQELSSSVVDMEINCLLQRCQVSVGY